MKKTKIIYLSISLVLAICCFVVVQSLFDSRPSTPLELTISQVNSQSFGLLYIAKKNGYFEDENLTVNFRNFALTADALDDTVMGNSDLAAVLEIPFIRSINDGNDLTIISSLHKSKNGSAIVGLKKSGINKATDLRGKRIGVVKSSNNEYVLYAILKNNNMKVEDVKVVFLNSGDITKSLASGAVDAASTANANLLSIQNSYKPEEITVLIPETYIATSILTGRTQAVKEKKEAVTRLLKALARAEDFYRGNKDASAKAIAEVATNTPEKTVLELWDNYELGLTLDNVLLEILNSQSHILKDMENYKIENVNFRSKILTDYLKEVKPSDVTLFK